MATNIVIPGLQRLTVPAPANVVSGGVVIVGQLPGVAVANALSGENVAVETQAVATIRKLNGASTSFAAGANVHWDATNANATVSVTSNARIGVAYRAAANADTLVQVVFNRTIG